ncbi:ATP-binding protein [Dactylosporangium sp. AC04546]|uniref:sensor histidine kinase n=1 Tax=Dactylosporangium sp. AC04546 TaxID=2862460 RepID=UPI001EDF508C|nr:ATP-binding protein [Dactylosporangium sp. AC04546]WVK89232.1 ATP-binding protein [Dactylosporangium sp. AC04546]
MRRRSSLRRQLMLIYAGPFFIISAVLLTIPLLGASQTSPVAPGGEPHPVQQTTEFPVTTWSLSLFGLMVLSLLVGWVVAGRFVAPLRTINSTAREISANNLHRRLGTMGRNDEFAELAETLDDLFARLEAAFVAQRQFVANASHELRTPLTAQRTLLQVAMADPDVNVDSLRSASEEVLALGAAQERLIGALLSLSDGQVGVERPVAFDLAAVARRVAMTRHATGVRITTRLHPAPMAGDLELVESLVANLVDNGLRHNVPDGWVEVVTETEAGYARVIVRNSGPVVPHEELHRLFEPFQRMKAQRVGHGDGHGLGLAIVRAIAWAHSCDPVARALPEGGLEVRVTFPPRGVPQ